MKLKQRDWTDVEQRLADVPRPMQQDRIVRTVLIAIVLFGVAVLAGVASYLVCVSATFEDIDKRQEHIRARIGN